MDQSSAPAVTPSMPPASGHKRKNSSPTEPQARNLVTFVRRLILEVGSTPISEALTYELIRLAQELDVSAKDMYNAMTISGDSVEYIYKIFRHHLPRAPAGIAELAEWDDTVPSKVNDLIWDLLVRKRVRSDGQSRSPGVRAFHQRMKDIMRRGYYEDKDVAGLILDSETLVEFIWRKVTLS